MEELHFLHRTITAKREAAAALLEELKQYDEKAFDNGELVLKNNQSQEERTETINNKQPLLKDKEHEPLQRKHILLHECIKDWQEAGTSPGMIKIYRNDNLFAGFIYEPYSDMGAECVMLANKYRNEGMSFYDLLHNLSLFVAEYESNLLIHNPITPEPKPEPQIHKRPTQQQTQNNPEKKNNRTKIAVIVAIVFGILYFTNYNDAKQEVIYQKYLTAMNEYNAACTAERNKTESDIAVTVKNTLISNNSVGNEWYIENYANNEPIHLVNSVLIENDNTIHLKFGNPITVETYIAEDDTWTDTAKNKYKHTFSKDDLIGGCYITQTTYVRENNGRYQGNIAKWETRYDFKAIMNYPEKPKQEDFTASFSEVNNEMLDNLFY